MKIVNMLWVVFFAFAALVIVFKGSEPLFFSEGPYPYGKPIAWLMFFSFLGYTLYCNSKEKFFPTMGKLSPFLWFRQISLDLYIGLVLTSYLIYLNEGSLLVLAIWIVPIILFANLTTLLYVAMNYDSIVANFVL